MKKSIFYDPKTTLASETIRDILPLEEEKQDNSPWVQGAITVALVINPEEDSIFGQLTGIEMPSSSKKELKIDAKVDVQFAYNFMTNVFLNEKEVECLILGFDGSASKFSGPFQIVSTKIIEVNENKKTCVFGIDLFKKTLE